eukprot:TRINITY_DN57561_c0_g1_i1.p1 TRINITY_DN57561_c0_g1~~TRINITY_DN57561_c0_g1_i1.p1  ORF type:complete len:547 (-),score=70.43 TRINITY_DN57561_c0_g1_i1:33-1673(-)
MEKTKCKYGNACKYRAQKFLLDLDNEKVEPDSELQKHLEMYSHDEPCWNGKCRLGTLCWHGIKKAELDSDGGSVSPGSDLEKHLQTHEHLPACQQGRKCERQHRGHFEKYYHPRGVWSRNRVPTAGATQPGGRDGRDVMGALVKLKPWEMCEQLEVIIQRVGNARETMAPLAERNGHMVPGNLIDAIVQAQEAAGLPHKTRLFEHQIDFVERNNDLWQEKRRFLPKSIKHVSQRSPCPFCFSLVPNTLLDDHKKWCRGDGTGEAQKEGCLSNTEKALLAGVEDNAKKLSDQAAKKLLRRIISHVEWLDQIDPAYKHDPKRAYDRLIAWMRYQCPMGMQIKHEALTSWAKEKGAKYKQQYECLADGVHCDFGGAGISDGGRTQWERNIYGTQKGGLVDLCTPKEHPRYGCLNVTRDPKGVPEATQYGDCFLVLRDTTTRWRTTFCLKDSSDDVYLDDMGTVQDCCHLLNKLSNDELREILFSACNPGHRHPHEYETTYREVQVLGELDIARDFIMLLCPSQYKGDAGIIEFCETQGMRVEFFEEEEE